MSPSSGPWSKKHKWIHDVFLSFRGREGRRNFADHLHSALRRASIDAFIDDELRRGEEISGSLKNAIEGSRIAVVVFSQNYAYSRSCLDELDKIMECHRNLGQVVLPVFYQVDPSDVRNQRGEYGEAMKVHERRFQDKVSTWRTALRDAANLSGWDSSEYRSEVKLFETIVEEILLKLDERQLFVAQHSVGIKSRIEALQFCLKRRFEEALIIGILGMGGTGKTTIAKALYNDICHLYEGRTSFLANVRDASKQYGGLVSLQKQLVSDITGLDLNIHYIDRGKSIIENRLRYQKALVVLDDVDELNQLRALCESRSWFGQWSVIIITTRDESILRVIQADHICRIRDMDESESLELLSWHAFKRAIPPNEYIPLSKQVVAYCGGLPLALEVLGSYLFERPIIEWESVLSKLKRIPNGKIQSTLQISFDGLDDDMHKDIFLDICCFFIGKDRGYVSQILDSCGFHAINGIKVLLERNLLKVCNNNKLGMHDLLRDMGREIIRAKSPKDLENRSRIWFDEDARNVLTEVESGAKPIEGLALKLPSTNEESFNIKAFEGMRRLRLLQLGSVKLDGDYKYISKHLRWLCWHRSPLRYIPKNFDQKNIVAIDLKYSRLKLVWKETQLLKSLKTLNLSHSCYISQTPDFTMIPNLENLILKDCPSLIIVHKSIGDLKNLLLLNLMDCKCLRDLPKNLYKLKSLKVLIISGCLMLDSLEEDFEQMESLTTLIADNTSIKEVPYSLARSKSIEYISVGGYEGRPENIFPSLILSWTSLRNTPQCHIQAFLGRTSPIISSAVQNPSFHGLTPILSALSMLHSISKECRPRFQLNGDIKGILYALCATNSIDLESRTNALQILDIEASASMNDHNQPQISRLEDSFNSLIIPMGVCNKEDMLSILQGCNYKYPDCFMYKGEGFSVAFKVPRVSSACLKAMVLNIAYSSCTCNMESEFLTNIWIINHTKHEVLHHKGDSKTCYEDEKWLDVRSTFEPGDELEVLVDFGCQIPVNKVVAYLVYGE